MRNNIFIKRCLFYFVVLLGCSACEKDKSTTPELSVSANELTFLSSGESKDLQIISTGKWQIVNLSNAITLSTIKGEGNSVIQITASENTTDNDIIGTLSIINTTDNLQQQVQFTILANEAGEVLYSVGAINTFSTGEQLILQQEDVAYIDKIIRIPIQSTSILTIDNIADYIFVFNTQPRNLRFTIQIPNANAWAPVFEENGVWNIVEYTTNGSVTGATFNMDFVKGASRSSVKQHMVRFALLNTSDFITNYNLFKNYYSNNPLSAIAVFEYPQAINNTITIKGQNNNDIIRTFTSNENLIDTIPILGLYNDWDNTIEFELTNTTGITYKFTQNIYCSVPYFNNLKIETSFNTDFRNDPEEIYFAISINFVSEDSSRPVLNDQLFGVGYDQWGKVRMIIYPAGNADYPITYKGDPAFVSTLSANFNGTFSIITYTGKKVLEASLHDSSDPYLFLHHECKQIDNSTLVFGLGSRISGAQDEFGIIEYNLNTNQFSNAINLHSILKNTRQLLDGSSPTDPIHVNAVDFSPSDNCYVISMRHQGIIKIHRETHEVRWIITPHININDLVDNVQSRLLTPTNFENTAEEWNIGQHSVTILPDGKIMCFDNHNLPSLEVNSAKRYSNIVVYSIDELSLTISKVWEFHTPDKKFSWYMGSAYMQQNGNVLGNWAVPQYAVEVKYGTNDIQWESYFKPANTRGDIYRTYKIKLYE